jgi:RNA polymerase sigma-70 factor (ECF subfamily)
MLQTENLTDSQIIQKICNGDVELFKILIRRANPLLYKTGRSYGYNHQDTQDLMQDAFIDAYLNLSKFENRSAFTTWMVKIMLNKCFQKTKKFSFKNESSEDILYDWSMPIYQDNKSSDANNIIMNRELNRIIEDAIMRIPLHYRLVFLCREINGLSVLETAEALSLSEANVKVRLNRAKAMMQKEIEKSYSKEDIFEFNLLYCDIMVNRVIAQIEKLNDKTQLN